MSQPRPVCDWCHRTHYDSPFKPASVKVQMKKTGAVRWLIFGDEHCHALWTTHWMTNANPEYEVVT